MTTQDNNTGLHQTTEQIPFSYINPLIDTGPVGGTDTLNRVASILEMIQSLDLEIDQYGLNNMLEVCISTLQLLADHDCELPDIKGDEPDGNYHTNLDVLEDHSLSDSEKIAIMRARELIRKNEYTDSPHIPNAICTDELSTVEEQNRKVADPNSVNTNDLNVTVLNEAINGMELSLSSISDLGTLFDSIRDSSDKHSRAHELSGIGSYLACDWAGLVDRQFEKFKNLDKDRH